MSTGGAGPTAAFTVITPSGQRRRTVASQFPFHVGRQQDNQLVLRDNRVSRVHARIDVDDGVFQIEDLNSRHGTMVNGYRLEHPRRLDPGDVITFGFDDGYQLIFAPGGATVADLAGQLDPSPTGGGHLNKLRSLVEVARALEGSFSIQEILEAVVDAALAVTQTDRGFLLAVTPAGLEVQVARDNAGGSLDGDDLNVPTQLIHRALTRRSELLSMNWDPAQLDASDADHSVARLELRSAVCVPLVRMRTALTNETMMSQAPETTGIIYLDSRVELADLSAGNRELLQSLALEASTVLENARLLEQERERHRLEQELEIARSIQGNLLPSHLPGQGWFRAAGISIASQRVGGDYYDAFPLSNEAWVIVQADVSGKGVSSALLAALLQGALIGSVEGPASIADMLDRVNKYMYGRTQGEKYATLFYGIVERGGVMHWVNAAHPAPIVQRANGEVEMLESTSMPVGMLDLAMFESRTTALGPGDKLVIFTDGLTEALSPAGIFFDAERVLEGVQALAGQPAGAVVSGLVAQVKRFTEGAPQADDITVLVVEMGHETHTDL